MNNNFPTHMLWVKGQLSNFELMSINSFVKHGYQLNLWTYDKIDNVPSGAVIRDAREILDDSEIFLNQEGSVASFADLFRYHLLNKIGGLWADCDVIALKDASEMPKHEFLVTEIMHNGSVKINNNVLYNPQPEPGNVVDLALAYATRFNKTKITWSEIGPDLLTAITNSWPKHGFSIAKPHFANPISYFEITQKFLSTDAELPKNSHFVHLINTIWKRNNIDKNTKFPNDTLIGRLSQKYLP